jgi:hypothetical protein
MDRREALRLLAGAATLTVLPPALVAYGREAHARLGTSPSLRTLDPHQDATVTAVADLIIPATDTPGAKAARVNEFIDLLLTEWMEEKDRTAFLEGLGDLDSRARGAGGKTFVEGTPEEQTRLLALLEDEAMRMSAQPGQHPEPFFRSIKRLTMYGYYTSEIGAAQELHFAVIPGRYLPCAPLGADTGREQ